MFLEGVLLTPFSKIQTQSSTFSPISDPVGNFLVSTCHCTCTIQHLLGPRSVDTRRKPPYNLTSFGLTLRGGSGP